MIKLLKKIYYYFFTKKIIKKNVDYKRNKYEDRNVLESIIFPHILSKFNPKTILDIGREDYQKFYNEFFHGREFWTIDYDPAKKEFGAKNHITDNVVNLKNHFKDNYFNLILMNGVFGWGLNKEKEVQTAFNAIYDILKPNGLFIFGWNDDIIPLRKINGLKKLKPYYFKPLGGAEFKCENGGHTYSFYVKA